MTTITQETILFTIEHIRHPNGKPEPLAPCSSCQTEAEEVERALTAWLTEQEVPNEITPEPEPRGLCRWHLWGCPPGYGYYEGPRQTLAGPKLF